MIDTGKLQGFLSTVGGHLPITVSVAIGAAVSVALLVLAIRALRGVRGASQNAKLTIGTAVVQAGVTWVVVTGTYAFCRTMFGLPWWEASAFAAFLEAATWVAVGMIYAHAKDKKAGFGSAGPFFWLFSLLGGLLAIIAGRTHGEMIGRAVVVVFGSCLWYLQLLRVTLRAATPGRFRWTPRRLLVAIGAIEPGDHDVADENREWQVRRLARAMRWANGQWPWSWLGRRALIRRGEATQEDVIRAARRRYAVTHLLMANCAPDSPVMQRVLAAVEAGHADSQVARTPDTGRVPVAETNGHVPVIESRAGTQTVVSISDVSARRRGGGQGQSADTSIEALADTLTKKFGREYVGTPKALEELRLVYGSCSKDRAIAAKDIHNGRREANTPPAAKPEQNADDDSKERSA